MFQSRAGGAVKFNFRLFVDASWQSPDRVRASARSRCAVSVWKLDPAPRVLFFLHDVEGALRQIAGLAGRLHPRAGLLQRILRVADFDANLLLQLLQAQFGLAIFEFGAILIGLGDSIAKRDVQVQAQCSNRARNC